LLTGTVVHNDYCDIFFQLFAHGTIELGGCTDGQTNKQMDRQAGVWMDF